MVVLVMTGLVLLGTLHVEATSAQEIAARRYAVHHKGLQWLGMSNDGVLANPYRDTLWVPELEYPGGSGTVFLYSGGLWVGAMRNGVPIVSVCVDGTSGTRECGPLEFATQEDKANEDIRSVGWLEKSTEFATIENQLTAVMDGRYLGIGIADFDDDGDGLIDEDPAGDMSHDYLDNDGDGLVDAEDPDYDGDVVPGSRDDDGDGLVDEDDSARAAQEFITAYVDTCESCLHIPDTDGFTPLGIRVVQHSYQWSWSFADDFIMMDFEVTNIGMDNLEGICLGYFFDFEVCHLLDNWRGDDYTYYLDDLQMAVGSDLDGDDGLLEALFLGVRAIETSIGQARIAYKNFDGFFGGDLIDNMTKYELMVTGDRDPDVFTEGDWRFILVFGPFDTLRPGESIRATFAIINGVEEADLIEHAHQAADMWDADLIGPSVPISPMFVLEPVDRGAKIKWQAHAELGLDRLTHKKDFQGHHIWRRDDDADLVLVARYDLPDTIGLNAGWPPPPSTHEEYDYEFVDAGLMNGIERMYVVTAFDDGDNGDGIHEAVWDERHGGVGIFESSRKEELWQTVVPAAAVMDSGMVDQVYVVPNPYIGSSSLEQYWQGEGRMEFRGLPPQCEIAIYTLAGDFVQELFHTNGLSWESWDLRNEDGREVAGGIYLYRIANEGKERIGKFVVVK